MRILLPKALVGLIGRVPMIKAVNAFLKFFNSSACEGSCFIMIIKIIDRYSIAIKGIKQ